MASFSKNVAYNVLRSISSVLFPLVSFVYASHVLMADSLGKVSYAGSFVSYFTLIAALGLSTYAIRECSKVRDDRKALEQLGSELFTINLLSTLVAYALLIVLLICADVLAEYRVLIVVQACSILATTIGADWVNSAMEDFRFIALRTAAFQVLALALLLIFVHSPDDYLQYAVILLVSSAGANIVNIAYRRRYCNLRICFNRNIKRHMTPILTLFSMQIAQVIYVNSDMTILGLFCGDTEVGIYSLSVKAYTVTNTFVASIAAVALPGLAPLFERGDYSEANKLLDKSFVFLLSLGLPCVAGLFMLAPDLVIAAGGASFANSGTPLQILCLALLFSYLGGFVGNIVLVSSGHERVCLVASIAAAIVNIVANLVLIPMYGSVAAAWTTAGAELVALIIVASRLRLEPQVRIGSALGWLPAVLLGCALICAICFAAQMFVPDPVVCVLLAFFLSVIVYAVVMLAAKNPLLAGIAARVGLRKN